MIKFTDKGIYCTKGRFYIDPWKPVAQAVITHGHSDHARFGSKAYLCHPDTAPILKLRLGSDTAIETLPYLQQKDINGVKVSFHPAGHIPGSAQVRMEYKGEIWVVSGDYKYANDGLSTPFEPVKCHHFVTESTFGLPVYQFAPPAQVYTEINQWWSANAADGVNSIILGYALGKSQSILNALDTHTAPIYLHGAVANVNDALAQAGYQFPGSRINADSKGNSLAGAMIVAPPSALGSSWLRRFQPFRIAFCSGWMALRGVRRRKGVDKGFVLSDHADWPQLNQAILETGAEHVYVTHGYENTLVRWLKERHHINAYAVKTLFHEAEEEDL